MRSLIHLLLLLLGVLAVVPLSARADTLFLNNGNVITGRLRELTDGTLLFHTPWAGTLHVDLKTVQSMETQQMVWLRMKGQGDFRLVSLRSRNHQTWLLDQEGQCILLRDKRKLAFLQAQDPRRNRWFWNGDLAVSLSLDQTSDQQEGIQTFGSTTIRNRDNRHTVRWDLEHVREEGETETQEQHVNYDYNHFVSSKMYLLGNGQWFYDRDESLRQRAVLGGGVGYQFWNSSDSSLKTDLGLSHLWEGYRSGNRQRQWALRWNLGYARTLFAGIEGELDLSTFYRPQSSAHLLWDLDTGLKYRVTERFSFNLRYRLERESSSGRVTREPSKKQLALGVGFGW